MIIWYISKYATPAKYFFGTRHFYLAEEWARLGHEVYVFTSNSSHLSQSLPRFEGKAFFETINGVKSIWLNTFKSKKTSGLSRIVSWFHFEWQLLTLRKRGRISKPDVVIASSLSLLSVISGYWFSRIYRAKFVFEVRDIWPLSAIVLGGYSPNNPFMLLLSFVEKFGYTHANLIVGTIPNLIEHVRTVTPRQVRCVCIPQGLNTRFYEENQEPLSREYIEAMLPRNKFIVCYAGAINANNPLEALIASARILRETNPEVCFLIVGSGEKKQALAESASDLSTVLFSEPIKKSQVYDLLSRVKCCYDSFDSRLGKYGISRNKWIDYMYAGKPIICSYGGFRSMINEAGCGSFVPYDDPASLADEIRRYASMDSRELEMVGMRGREFLLANRTFEKLARQYVHEIHDCDRTSATAR
jgi:glycosyltransferase involved in cell wall biosynthesis